MTTFSELLTTIRREQFVGRSSELRIFDQWLADDVTSSHQPILVISGPGGIGKSWLVEACARRAVSSGWTTRHVDVSAGGSASGSRGEQPLLGESALSEPAPGESRRDAARLVIFVDGMEDAGPSLPVLLRELAELDAGTKVVLCGRTTLTDGVWRRWQPLMRHVELGPLTRAAQRRYLDLRGVDDRVRRGQVLSRAGGNPLILSLAVDLVLNSPDAALESSGLWRSAVRASVDELVMEIGAQFRDALDAAAVLQRFDRDALVALLGRDAADSAFVRLCSFTAIKIADDQLALHDDVRRCIVEDLRLHHPARLEALRRRALRYYRRVAARASGDEGMRLSVERMHMVGRDVFGMNTLYDDDPRVTVGPAVRDDIDDILALLRRSQDIPGLPRIERDPRLLRTILEHADTFAQVARDSEGALVAYGFCAAISERNRPLLGATDAMATLLDAVADELGCADGRFPEASNIYFLSTVMIDNGADPGVIGTMSRHIMHLFLREGAYFMVPARPDFVAVADGALTHPILPGLTEDGVALQARLLDLSRCGTESWLRDMMAGGPLYGVPVGGELTASVRDLLPLLGDDVAVAASSLARIAEPDTDVPVNERADAARELLIRATKASGPWPTPELRIREAFVAAGQSTMAALRSWLGESADADDVAVEAPVRERASSPGPVGMAVKILGGFEVWVGESTVSIPHGTVATVIKLLAIRSSITADELIELLWPEVDPVLGKDRLRTVLARVRRAVGADIVVRKGEVVLLADTVSVDAVLFSDLAAAALVLPRGNANRAARARTAIAAYCGELLPGDRFADWAVAPRERLARLYLDLLDSLADEAVAAGDLQETLRSLEKAIETDPYEEHRYLRAAHLLFDAGRRGQALAILQRAEAAAVALGLSPSAQIVDLQRRLRSAS